MHFFSHASGISTHNSSALGPANMFVTNTFSVIGLYYFLIFYMMVKLCKYGKLLRWSVIFSGNFYLSNFRQNRWAANTVFFSFQKH